MPLCTQVTEMWGEPAFICEDCKREIYSFLKAPKPPVCYTCSFIREHPELPEKIKKTLLENH